MSRRPLLLTVVLAASMIFPNILTAELRIQRTYTGDEPHETYEVRSGNEWVPAIRYLGPRILVERSPLQIAVLEDFEAEPLKWQRNGLPASVETNSTRQQFRQQGDRFVGTCETPQGTFDDSYTGTLESPPLSLPHRYLSLLVGGGNKPKSAYVAIIDAQDGNILHTNTGKDSEQFHRVTVDLAEHHGKQIIVRIVDQDKGPWGHINVDNIVSHDQPFTQQELEVSWSENGPTVKELTLERQLDTTDSLLRVRHLVTANQEIQLLAYEDRYQFLSQDPDFVWSQSIKHEPNAIIPHWQFKTPALMFQKDSLFAALLPQLDDLTGNALRRYPTALDLANAEDDEYPTLSYGVVPSVLTFHSIFSRAVESPLQLRKGESFSINHEFLLNGSAEPRKGYRDVVRHVWKENGEPALLASPGAQQNFRDKHLALFDDWRHETWHRYARDQYREYEMDGYTCGTLISKRAGLVIPANPDDAMFNSWFQTLRTAYGMHLYAVRAGDSELQVRSTNILNMALAAPRNKGAFPTVYWHGADGSHNWMNDNGESGYGADYHMFDMTWTGYWMLRFREANHRREEILADARALGDFLLANQRSDGFIPSWYNQHHIVRQEFSGTSAEPAGAAAFLAALYQHTRDLKYLDAAVSAMNYIESSVIPEHKWADYEVYLSCSRKGYEFYDPHTRQHPQNNLVQIQAALAYHELFKATGNSEFLDKGCVVLDYLLLTQQVANHPLQTPAMIGGFTTQNTDAEWSDARQAYCADLLFDYYDSTGELEYLERAVAALRSTFAVAPYENWSHCGFEDAPGAMTGIHWGTGSAMTSVEIAHDRYRDIFIDAKLGHAIGINGCTLSKLQLDADRIQFDLNSPFAWKKPAVLIVRNPPISAAIIVNGRNIGTFSIDQMQQGIELPAEVVTSN